MHCILRGRHPRRKDGKVIMEDVHWITYWKTPNHTGKPGATVWHLQMHLCPAPGMANAVAWGPLPPLAHTDALFGATTKRVHSFLNH